MTDIIFRPHHLVCTIGFKGLGYSRSFVSNYLDLIKVLKQNEFTKILITDRVDSICIKCPYKKGNSCFFQKRVQLLDKLYSKLLEVKQGDIFTWQQVKNKIKNNMNMIKFHEICSECQWKQLGLCEKAICRFISS